MWQNFIAMYKLVYIFQTHFFIIISLQTFLPVIIIIINIFLIKMKNITTWLKINIKAYIKLIII